MRIAVVGTGYVGLVTGTCFAESGNDVTCIDVDKKKIASLQEGTIPIYEPGLKELIEHNAAGGRLAFTTNVEEGVQGSEVIFIAVGTPQDRDGSADMRFVQLVKEEYGLKDESTKLSKGTQRDSRAVSRG